MKKSPTLCPCPNCGKPINPASLLAKIRLSKMTKKEIRASALKASYSTKAYKRNNRKK